MSRYFIHLAYNGTNYCGWQIQPNALSVQEILEESLSTLLRKKTTIIGAGRTDAGVHARKMTAHFDTDTISDKKELTNRLNKILPRDVAIYDIVDVKNDAHARFDALSRLYRYYVTEEKDPFLYPFKHKICAPLHIESMNRCSEILFEYVDFTSFSKLHTDVKTNNCKIMHAHWEKQGSEYIFTIQADRFLRNMVRAIVGTLFEVGRQRLDEAGFRTIIESKNRNKAGHSVPANALFLEEVEYPKTIFTTNTEPQPI